MKVLIPNKYAVTGSGADHQADITSAELSFSEVGNGRHVGLVPIRMKEVPAGSNKIQLERLYRVEIQSEASDNGRGYRRVVLKVTIPYHRVVTTDAGASQPSDRVKQESASAGSLSMHVVLSIPSKVRTDLLESSDPASTYGAEAHIGLVAGLLGSLTRLISHQRNLTSAQNDNTLKGMPCRAVSVDDAGKARTTIPAGGTGVLPALLVGGPAVMAETEPYLSDTYGQTGLSIGDGEGPAFAGKQPGQLQRAARDPMVRGLFGLSPIEENTSIVATTPLVAGIS